MPSATVSTTSPMSPLSKAAPRFQAHHFSTRAQTTAKHV